MEWWSSRRGQSASGSAVLVAIIAGVILLYLLFLPPQEREQLLFGEGSQPGGGYVGGSGGVFTQFNNYMLLSATPGSLRAVASPIEEHLIPSATIFTRLNTQVLKQLDSAIVKNGIFAQRDVDIEFDASSESNNYLLSFNVEQAAAQSLRVMLNGHLLYERPVRETSPQPIPLPREYLKPAGNVLTLETDSPGLAFWQSNAYMLRNILVTADIIDLQGSVSEQTFSVSQRELDSFESAQLQFVPECDPTKAGRLTVQLNQQEWVDANGQRQGTPNIVYTGFVDCGVLFKTDIAPENLRAGENRILFASDQGQYVVDRIKLIVSMEQTDYPVYYFNLPLDMYDAINANANVVRLTLQFADFRPVKRGELVINGFVKSFDTQDLGYEVLLDPAILTPGPNTVQVIPHVDRLDIAELTIELI